MTVLKAKVTIADVAKAAGVSTSAVSYALNGKPGVSLQTRERVLETARQLGWQPNSAAKALSVASTKSIGVVLSVYDAEQIGIESFSTELLSGLSAELGGEGYSIVLRVTSGGTQESVEIHRQWIASGQVDAHLVTNVELGDPRIALFREHDDTPALFLCPVEGSGGMMTLSSDEVGGVESILDCLYAHGHRHVARVAGPERYVHTLVRDRAFNRGCVDRGIAYDCLHGDYSPSVGGKLVKTLLDMPDRPTALIFDNDATAIMGLRVASERGMDVPGDLSILSWDDSFMCRMAVPAVASLRGDVFGDGRLAGRMLLDKLAGREVRSAVETPYVLQERASIGTVTVA